MTHSMISSVNQKMPVNFKGKTEKKDFIFFFEDKCFLLNTSCHSKSLLTWGKQNVTWGLSQFFDQLCRAL